MIRFRLFAATAVLAASAFVMLEACQTQGTGPGGAAAANATAPAPGSRAHRDRVMTSRFCADCHPAFFAEHAQNTHGRAFTDEEARLATGHFEIGDCIRCHTPRPIFETGIGMNPMRRYFDLEEGNTCMTCHWRAGYDYGRFEGGAECRAAFDPRAGTVEACASCHRNHGTPYQWEKAPTGKAAGRLCIDCHMATVTRPVAVGEPPRPVRSHVFPASRDGRHLRRAYGYAAEIEGNEVVVRLVNRGAGHNFPTELKQRSVESLVVVRDTDGNEVARSRMVFRDPYKRPYGLQLPVNTQIPAGETREHAVPLSVPAGSVECELHYKLYYPIEDFHPDLARLLESRVLLFDGVTPNDAPVPGEAEVPLDLPESITPEAAGLGNLADFAHPSIGTVAIDVPDGDSPADIAALIELFQFPVPEGNARARDRLVAIGMPAVPALIEAMGSWDNKTWNQAMAVLQRIGEAVGPAVLRALRESDQLYVRVHARELLVRIGYRGAGGAVIATIRGQLDAPNALDRASAAKALGAFGATEASVDLRRLAGDEDPDVVRAAALSLAALGAAEAVPDIERALGEASFAETRCDLAMALAALGSPAGIPTLLDGLDHPDDLVREAFFRSLFAVTGQHMGYQPLAPRDERLAAIGRLRVAWAEDGGDGWLRRPPEPDPVRDAKAAHLVAQLGGGDGAIPGGDDAQIVQELVALGDDAVPALVRGLQYPPGFAQKRARICEALGRIGSRAAAPALAYTLRDPVVSVAAWACWALGGIADPDTSAAVERYRDRIRTLAAAGRVPSAAGSVDALLAQAAGTRLALGDGRAEPDLVRSLLSDDVDARRIAIQALTAAHGDARGYDPEASRDARRAAAARWAD